MTRRVSIIAFVRDNPLPPERSGNNPIDASVNRLITECSLVLLDYPHRLERCSLVRRASLDLRRSRHFSSPRRVSASRPGARVNVSPIAAMPLPLQDSPPWVGGVSFVGFDETCTASCYRVLSCVLARDTYEAEAIC